MESLHSSCSQAYAHFRGIRPPWEKEEASKDTYRHWERHRGGTLCTDSKAMQQHLVTIMEDALGRLGRVGWTTKQICTGPSLNLYALTKNHDTVSDGGAFHLTFLQQMLTAAWAFTYSQMDENAPRWGRDENYDHDSLETARPYFVSSLTKRAAHTAKNDDGDEEAVPVTAIKEEDPIAQTAVLLHAIMVSRDASSFYTTRHGPDFVREAVFPYATREGRKKKEALSAEDLEKEGKHHRMTSGSRSTLICDLLGTFSPQQQARLCTMVLRYEEIATVRMARKGSWGRQFDETSHTMDLISLLVKKREYEVAHRLLVSNPLILEELTFDPVLETTKEWRGHHYDTNKESGMNLMHLVAAYAPIGSPAKLEKILALIEEKNPGILTAMIHSNTNTHESTGVSGKGYSSGFVASFVSPVALAFFLGRNSALQSLSILSQHADVFGEVNTTPPSPGGKCWGSVPAAPKRGGYSADEEEEEANEEEEEDNDDDDEEAEEKEEIVIEKKDPLVLATRPPPKLFECVYTSHDEYEEDLDAPAGGAYYSALGAVDSLSLPGCESYAAPPAKMALSLYTPCKIDVDRGTLERLKSLNFVSLEALFMLLHTPVDPTLHIDNVDWRKVELCPHSVQLPKGADADADGDDKYLIREAAPQKEWTQECFEYTGNGSSDYQWKDVLGMKTWSSEAIALCRRSSLPINRLDPKVWKIERTVRWMGKAEIQAALDALPENERSWKSWRYEKAQVDFKFTRRDGKGGALDIPPLFAKIAEMINSSTYPDTLLDGMEEKFWGYEIWEAKGDSHSVKGKDFKWTEDHKATLAKTKTYDSFESLKRYLPLRQCPFCNELPEYLEKHHVTPPHFGDFAGRSSSGAVVEYPQLARNDYTIAQVTQLEELYLDSSGFFFALKLRELLALGFRIPPDGSQPPILNYDVICDIASFLFGNAQVGASVWDALGEGKKIKFNVSETPAEDKKKRSSYSGDKTKGLIPLDLHLNSELMNSTTGHEQQKMSYRKGKAVPHSK